jgi:hypothetical protein
MKRYINKFLREKRLTKSQYKILKEMSIGTKLIQEGDGCKRVFKLNGKVIKDKVVFDLSFHERIEWQDGEFTLTDNGIQEIIKWEKKK